MPERRRPAHRAPAPDRPQLRLLGRALSALTLTAVVVVALAAIVIPKVMGATPYTVLTGSMRPTMDPGTLAIVQPVDPDTIQVGDVVTFQIAPGRPEVVTHRVTAVHTNAGGQRSFTTQGDANTRADADPVVPDQIRGTVAYALPWMGHVNSALSAGSRSWLMVAAAGALVTYGLWQVASGLRRPRNEPAAAPAS